MGKLIAFKKFITEDIDLPKIYLDLDGVLADFAKGAKDLGITQDKDIHWDNIKQKSPDFWNNLDLLRGASQLWDFVKKYRPCILSATPSEKLSSWVIDGKMKWIKKNLDMKFIDSVHIVRRSKKKDFAINKDTKKPNLLVDDLEKNCDEWRAAGGLAIQHKNLQQTLAQLKEFGFSK